MSLKFVFVTGEKRSGTTLLSNFLNSQNEIVCFSDTYRSLFDNANALELKSFDTPLSSKDRNVIISSLIPKGFKLDIDLSYLWEISNPSWLDIFKACLTALKSNNEIFVGVKITAVNRFLPVLLENGFKVIYIQRDPRDVMYSSKNRFGAFFLNSQITNWKESFWEIDKIKKDLHFHYLKYEDLILNKDEELTKIEEFLEVRFERDVKVLSIRKGVKFSSNSSFGDVKSPFDKKGVMRWKSNSDNNDIQYTASILKNEIKLAGYESFDISFLKSTKFKVKYFIRSSIRKIVSSFEKTYKKYIK